MFATTTGMQPGELAALCEQRGHAALYFAEHTHLPADTAAEPPKRFRSTYDPFVATTAAAASTSRLRVGSAVCLVAQHDPLVLAKTIATADRISGGRVDFGVGAGWVDGELVNHGVDPKRRFARMRDNTRAIRSLWTEERASFHGDQVGFSEVVSEPKPSQWPHPPVLIGGMGPKVLQRVVEYGDAWLPDYRDADTFEHTLARIPELRSRAADAGRELPVVLAGVPHDPRVLERCEQAGVSRVLTLLPSANRSVVERSLEQYELAIADWRGE